MRGSWQRRWPLEKPKKLSPGEIGALAAKHCPGHRAAAQFRLEIWGFPGVAGAGNAHPSGIWTKQGSGIERASTLVQANSSRTSPFTHMRGT